MHAFFSEIADQLECEADEAERLAAAVIATLEERLPFEELPELEAELPDCVRDLVAGDEKVLDLPEMDDDAFRKRVMHRLRVTEEDADRIIAAVLAALEHELSPREVRRAIYRASRASVR